jgi:hypothetical protein
VPLTFLTEFLGMDFLRGETEKEYYTYKKSLLKPMMKKLGKTAIDTEEVEKLCDSIFHEIQVKHGKISTKLIAYTLILQEIKKRVYKKTRREVK